MLFTRQFIKDLAFSLVFILCMYGIVHNPLTYPVPQPIPGNWSIQLMQHPLFFGLAGHNYLVVRNQDGDIVSELHGLATDTTTKKWKYVGMKSSDVLQVWKFDGPRYYLAEKGFSGILLNQGTQGEVESIWEKTTDCITLINAQNIPYPPFGVKVSGETENSNSVAYTLALCMGLDARHIGILTPGETKNLLMQPTK